MERVTTLGRQLHDGGNGCKKDGCKFVILILWEKFILTVKVLINQRDKTCCDFIFHA